MIPFPDKKYSIIYADPPWSYSDSGCSGAAAAQYALDHNIGRLADDHVNARSFAEAVAVAAPGVVAPELVATNIVVLDVGDRAASQVVATARRQGVGLSAVGSHLVRAVTHLDAGAPACRDAGRLVGELLAT